MIDWNLTVDRDISIAPRSWREAGTVSRIKQYGGAWMLADLIEKFAADTEYAGRIRRAATRDDEVHQTWSVIAPVGDDKVWRVKEFLGIERHPAQAGRAVGVDAEDADVVVLLDSDFGFEDDESAWPAAITARREQPPWIILKTSVPAFQGKLWPRLMEKHADRLIVVMNVDDFRRKELQLIRRLSWERTAQDLVREIDQSEALRGLRRAKYVLVSFGTAGAMLLPKEEAARLVFDPASMEGEREADEGMMIGYTTVLAAAVAHEVMIHPKWPQLVDALPRGIAGMRALLKNGFGKGQASTISTEAIAAAALSGEKLVSTVTVADPARTSWTILEERLGGAARISPDNDADDVLYELAARVAVYGPDQALSEVPQLRIKKLFAVDRDEIESLRTVKGLLTEYVQRRPSKPLSIAVFGSPGSGKSFAVKQIAESIGRGRIESLTFNMTQFTRSTDLHGAFHQVRDVSLRGKIPIVFWDEFDSRYDGEELGWLRYFIGPMQDGEFQEAQITHPIGTSIFVFAGGTATSKSEFVEGALSPERKALKVPDFISRLKGFLNVTGPNRRDASDVHSLIRRAILLRSMLEAHCPDLFSTEKKVLRIDPGVLHAFLSTTNYLHGARSLESVIAMSTLSGRKHFDSSSLPPESQLALHVAMPFESLAYEVEFTHDVARLERLAEAAHEVFRDVKTKQGWKRADRRDDANRLHNLLKPYAELAEHEKEANRAHIRWIPQKLAEIGYSMAPAGSGEAASLSDDDVRLLARKEHDIWMQRKLAAGYVYGPAATDSPKQSPYLVPWDELQPDWQAVDIALSEAVPDILRLADYILTKKCL